MKDHKDMNTELPTEAQGTVSEAYLSAIVGASQDGIFVVDDQGKFEFGNNAFFQILGWPREELIGHHFIKVIPPDFHEFILERWEEVQRGKGKPYEVDIVTKAGHRRSLSVSHKDLHVRGERKYCVVAKDATERKRAMEALEASEGRWRSLVENAPNVVVKVDRDGRILSISHPFSGISGDEVIGRRIYEFASAESHDVIQLGIEEVFRTGEATTFETRASEKHGSLWFTNRAGPIGRDEQVIAVIIVATDITEQKRTEEALRESQALANAVIEGTTDSVYVKDTQGRYRMINAATARALGKPKEEVIGKDDAALFRPELASRFVATDREIIDSGQVTTYEETTGSGDEVITWLATKGPYFDEEGRVLGIFGISRDITGLKRAEDELRKARDELEQRVEQRTADLVNANTRLDTALAEHKESVRALLESEERFQELARTIDQVVWSAAVDGSGVLYLNPTAEEVYGRPCSEFFETPNLWLEVVHSEDQTLVRESIGQLLKVGSREIEYRIIRPDGQVRWLLDRARVICDAHANPVALGGIATDITRLKQAEEAKYQSQNKLRAIIEHMPDFVLVVDQDAKLLYANREVPGVPMEALTGSLGFNHIDPEYREQCRAAFEQAFRMRHVQSVECLTIYDRWWDCRIVPLDQDGEALNAMIICADITEKKQAAEKLAGEQDLLRKLLDLQEQERKLVAYEIHDGFVQDVVGAKMMLEGSLQELESQDALGADQLRSISDLLQRAIIEGRRMISELRPMIIDEQGIVAAIDHLIAEEYSDPVWRVDFSPPLDAGRLAPMLEGAIFRITQEALLNAKRHSRGDSAKVKLTFKKGRLLLEIRDDGVGFDPSLVPNERFGLRGIRERARLFGGHATIDSAPGDGTRIKVELPSAEEVGDGASPA